MNGNIPKDGWDIVVAVHDDLEPCVEGFDDIIAGNFEKYYPDLYGALHLNEGIQNFKLSTLSIIGKKLYDKIGYLNHPSYKNLYSDNEFTSVLQRAGLLMYLPIKVIEHKWDEINDGLRRNTESDYATDKQNYINRKSEMEKQAASLKLPINKIGLVLTCFNRPEFLEQTLKSLEQSIIPSNLNIMIIDDSSTDEKTLHLIDNFKLKSIKMYNAKNKGVYECLKQGWDYYFNAGYDVLMNLDSDVIIRPNWLEKVLELENKFPDYVISGFNCNTSHPCTSKFDNFYTKKSIGGLNLCFNRTLYPAIRQTLYSLSWDWEMSEIMEIASKIFIVTRPSVIQHNPEANGVRNYGINNPDGKGEFDVAFDFCNWKK
jgi:hypothetical protein